MESINFIVDGQLDSLNLIQSFQAATCWKAEWLNISLLYCNLVQNTHFKHIKSLVNGTKLDEFWLIVMKQNFLDNTNIVFYNVTKTVDKNTTFEIQTWIKEGSLMFT